MTDLVQRLRRTVYRNSHYKDDTRVPVNPDGPEAADRIEALEAEVKRLRGAISWIEPPFVHENTPADELRSRIGFCIADMRAALEARHD